MKLSTSLASPSFLELLVERNDEGARSRSSEPLVHQALFALGVLQRPTSSWDESERLTSLPWGPAPDEGYSPHLPADLRGPWPDQATIHPDFAARIRKLPEEERQLHRNVTVRRYMRQLATLVPRAASRALREPRIRPLDDARFSEILNETCLSQFMTALEARDHELFAAHMAARPAPADAWVKFDTSVLDSSASLPGVYVAPTRTLMRYDAASGGFEPIAIHFEDEPAQTFTPADGAAWELARYFVLQGLAYILVLVFHPRLHMPGDTVNAVTRTLLGPRHPIHELLAPHMRYALGLNEAVVNHRRSVLHNSQRELYAPFPVQTEAIHRSATIGFEGLPGSTAYPAYRWQPYLLDPRTPYGRYRRDWFELVRSFVADALEDRPHLAKTRELGRWADSIAAWVPGFPDASAIARPGALVEALSIYIAHTAVFHTADHDSYGKLPAAEIPWRLRVPPPNRVRPQTLDDEALVSREDYFRHLLAKPMFFEATVVESIADMRYAPSDPRARAACIRFAQRMPKLDARWSGSGFASSAAIAASIQS